MSTSLSLVVLSFVFAIVDEMPKSEALVPDGFTAKVVATDPLIQDAVAFSVDPSGNLLIAETERTNHGAMDNRSSPWHLEDDLQSRTVEDRVAYMEKWAHKQANGMSYYTEAPDRVRRSVDADGDGIYDRHTIFAGPFNEVADGIGAGVMPVGDEVWYTNIPHLWRLIDADGDGVAETRESIQSGFGVRFALYGHDMHGLAAGPDGRIYWSIGDRGYHLVTPDGRTLADPRGGAVFRCERDGSNLEVFATGLRNPQELAFNAVGDLFTGDNTSDAGDRARIVFVAQEGETGWTMDYQTLEGANLRGPWEQERIWEVVTDANAEYRPDWTLPPIAHVGAGPSGLTYDPGLGLPDAYRDHFFLCDFTGSRTKSRIWTFRPVPEGAGYRVEDPRVFATGILNTDVDFDWNGRMLVSEWGKGWSSSKKGRLHAIEHPERMKDPRIAEARSLAIAGMESLDDFTLADLLSHPARRLRLMAQYELAERDAVAVLAGVARYETEQSARLHAIWGLGQIARSAAARNRRTKAAMTPVMELLNDADAEVRAQAAKVLGDPAYPAATDSLIEALADDSLRVRYHAAMALGSIGDVAAAPYLLAMLAENDDRDRFLRHAGVVALVALADRNTIEEMMASPAAALRRASVLVLRRLGDPGIERLLFDVDPRIRTEAARAVHDVPIASAMPALASLADQYRSDGGSTDGRDLEIRREIFRIGRNEGAADLMTLSSFDGDPDEVEIITSFQGLTDGGEEYLSRLTGRVVAPQTGTYRFSIASDDASLLRLSLTGARKDLQPVAEVRGWVGMNEWTGQSGQTSKPVELMEGQEILIEARHAQGGGGNHLAVAWTLPDGTFEAPIGGSSVSRLPTETPLLRRVVDANLRGGTRDDLERLTALAMNHTLPPAIEAEVMLAIATFDEPGPRDRVLGWWRPVDQAPRSMESMRSVLARTLPVLADDSRPLVRASARATASRLGVALDPEMLRATVFDREANADDRAACLAQLVQIGDEQVSKALEVSLRADDPELRAAARDSLASIDARGALAEYEKAMSEGVDIERQRAILGLARINDPQATDRLRSETDSAFADSEAPRAWMVELLEAGSSSGDEALVAFAEDWKRRSLEDPSVWDVALLGGDPTAGARVARYHPSAACLRCHVIGGMGGDAGPSLEGLGARTDSRQILQSIIDPQAVLVEGYGEVSAMPNMRPLLTPREVRDLVAYLSTLTETVTDGH
ncbi:MAG: hypothetical protein CMJ23_13430 [Phycisphaerae bacterium]|nr:hypothetical protein [Phycisphaerae bacterium]